MVSTSAAVILCFAEYTRFGRNYSYIQRFPSSPKFSRLETEGILRVHKRRNELLPKRFCVNESGEDALLFSPDERLK